MDPNTIDTNEYGGFLSMDDEVCLFQAVDGSVPVDIPTSTPEK